MAGPHTFIQVRPFCWTDGVCKLLSNITTTLSIAITSVRLHNNKSAGSLWDSNLFLYLYFVHWDRLGRTFLFIFDFGRSNIWGIFTETEELLLGEW
jgi:hypothetical protein